jgi:hypothetical protein
MASKINLGAGTFYERLDEEAGGPDSPRTASDPPRLSPRQHTPSTDGHAEPQARKALTVHPVEVPGAGSVFCKTGNRQR